MKITGQEHSDQRQRHRQDGEADLARADQSGLRTGFCPILDMADDVLEHDDGVVDHEADAQRQGEQRDVVDGEVRGATCPAKVPISEIGRAMAGISVARALRRKK